MKINNDALLWFMDSDGAWLPIGTLKSVEVDKDESWVEHGILTNISSDKVWTFHGTLITPSRVRKSKAEIRENKIWKAYHRCGHLTRYGKTKRIRKKNEKRILHIFDLMEENDIYY